MELLRETKVDIILFFDSVEHVETALTKQDVRMLFLFFGLGHQESTERYACKQGSIHNASTRTILVMVLD